VAELQRKSARRHGLYLIVAFSLIPGCLSGQTQRNVDLKRSRPSELTILKSTGTATLNRDLENVRVKKGEMLLVRLPQPVVTTKAAGGSLRHELPYRLFGVGPSGNELDFDVVVDIDGGGMRPSPDAAGFLGRVYFGVIDKKQPGSRQTLPVPVNFLVTADVDSISPSGSIDLDHTNLPFVPLTLSAKSPRDAVTLHVRSSLSPSAPVNFEVDVLRPELTIDVSPKTIQGWGLEEADVTVTAKRLLQPAGTEVTFSTTKGGLATTTTKLTADGIGGTRIRSIGLGRARVSSASPLLTSASTELDFAFPWAYAISAIAGGLVGSIAKQLTAKPMRLKVKRVVLGLIAGVALGILGAAAYTIGVNLTGYVPQARVGEALIFFVAGIVSYTGALMQKGSTPPPTENPS
jgi:hypothetical protein